MTFKVNFIERHSGRSPSIERVFRAVADSLNELGIETFFEKLPYGDGTLNVARNLREFRPKKADIYHVTGHATYIALILPPSRSVVTFHDLTLLTLRKGARRKVLEKLYYDWPARKAARITSISAATADGLAELTGIDRSSITVIDNPCLIPAADQATPFNAETPRILQIGTAPNKNVVNLLRAVSGLECIVQLVGLMTDDIDRELNSNGVQFEHSSSLNDREMVEAYSRADIVTLCSTIEGFGLPIVEAQAMCVPVITSDLPPMNDVAGEGALKVDPNDPFSIRRAIEILISDEDLRIRLTAAGRRNAERFEPSRIAREYAAVYNEILSPVNK